MTGRATPVLFLVSDARGESARDAPPTKLSLSQCLAALTETAGLPAAIFGALLFGVSSATDSTGTRSLPVPTPTLDLDMTPR